MGRWIWSVVASVGLVCLVILAGCSSSVTTARATQTSTPSPSPTASATATATATIPATTAAACFGSGYAAHNTITQVGDFLMTPVNLSGHAYGSVALPAGISLTKPYQLPSGNALPSSLTTNPSLDEGNGGFSFGLCNISASQTHTITSVTATIAKFTAYSGQLSQWDPCQGSMTSHRQLTPAGCGGGGVVLPSFHATFQGSPAVGMSVEMRQTGLYMTGGSSNGSLPLAIAPGTVIYFGLGMDTLSQAGNYAFTFGMRFQNGETPLTSTASPTVLLAPVAHNWDGRSCNQSAFLSQITATNPETYYVCPAS